MREKHERFAIEYIKDRNATQAAIRAGYSPKTAGSQGNRLLQNAEIATRIANLTEKACKRAHATAEDVIQALSDMLFLDPAELLDNDGNPLPLDKVPPHVRRCIEGLDAESKPGATEYDPDSGDMREVEPTTIRKVKFSSRIKAAELLGKYHKLFVDRVEHSATEELADRMAAAQRRAGMVK
jgi:phage terminase small subunit